MNATTLQSKNSDEAKGSLKSASLAGVLPTPSSNCSLTTEPASAATQNRSQMLKPSNHALPQPPTKKPSRTESPSAIRSAAAHPSPIAPTATPLLTEPPAHTSPTAPSSPPFSTTIQIKPVKPHASPITPPGKKKRKAKETSVVPESKRTKTSKAALKSALEVLPKGAVPTTIKKGSSNLITKIRDINAMSKQINIIVKVLNRFVGRMNSKSGRRLELELADDSGRIGAVFFDSDNDVAKMSQLDKLSGCEIGSVRLISIKKHYPFLNNHLILNARKYYRISSVNGTTNTSPSYKVPGGVSYQLTILQSTKITQMATVEFEALATQYLSISQVTSLKAKERCNIVCMVRDIDEETSNRPNDKSLRKFTVVDHTSPNTPLNCTLWDEAAEEPKIVVGDIVTIRGELTNFGGIQSLNVYNNQLIDLTISPLTEALKVWAEDFFASDKESTDEADEASTNEEENE